MLRDILNRYKKLKLASVTVSKSHCDEPESQQIFPDANVEEFVPNHASQKME
jgi:hypothetical protein